ncbi:MAG: ribonuclease E inhibitor RraB [Thalassotalea sp.]
MHANDVYPNDDTGNVLADMAAADINLSIEHDVVFFQLFEDQNNAQAMVDFIVQNHPEIKVALHPDESPNVWDVDCTLCMLPSYQQVVEQEEFFEKIAAKFSGYNDGWGIEA